MWVAANWLVYMRNIFDTKLRTASEERAKNLLSAIRSKHNHQRWYPRHSQVRGERNTRKHKKRYSAWRVYEWKLVTHFRMRGWNTCGEREDVCQNAQTHENSMKSYGYVETSSDKLYAVHGLHARKRDNSLHLTTLNAYRLWSVPNNAATNEDINAIVTRARRKNANAHTKRETTS